MPRLLPALPAALVLLPLASSPASAQPSLAAPAAQQVATARPAGAYAVEVLSVYDGDTMRVRYQGRSERLRVIGIDAPEISPAQCYGSKAAAKMRTWAGRTVYIKVDSSQANRDKYGRLLRHAYNAGGTSLGLAMIRGGYAKEYTYSRAYHGQYGHRRAEAKAKSSRVGLWGSCGAGKPKTPAKPKPPTSSCVIKGNIASDGERIYHVPSGRYYGATKIDTSKGERWFCTEKQAVNAGWRRSKL